MADTRLNDMLRQFAVVLTAISQVYFSYAIGREVGGIAQENRSLILPASYAFSIWGAIFLLCLLYAVYQALPANRESPIFRAVGWWSAGAFLCNTIWNQIYINRQFVLSQVVIFCGVLFAGMAVFRFIQTAKPEHLSAVENWVVGPAFGLLFGWLTAANVVGLASVLVVAIGWLYLVPQLQGAGLTLRATTGAPAWAGAVLVAVSAWALWADTMQRIAQWCGVVA